MFTNKHVIVALLVMPILAILAWFAVGALVGEKPQSAVAGQSYPLVERSNCRYDSGQCDLRNEDMRLTIFHEEAVVGAVLVIEANQPLGAAFLGVSAEPGSAQPAAMQRRDSAGRKWEQPLERLPAAGERLFVVVEASGSRWYVDTSTAFLERFRQVETR